MYLYTFKLSNITEIILVHAQGEILRSGNSLKEDMAFGEWVICRRRQNGRLIQKENVALKL